MLPFVRQVNNKKSMFIAGPVVAEVNFIDSISKKFCPNFLAFVVPRTQERHDELGPDDNRHWHIKNQDGLAAGGRTEWLRNRPGKNSGDEAAERVLDGWQHPLTKSECALAVKVGGYWWKRLKASRHRFFFYLPSCLRTIEKGLIWLLHSCRICVSCRRFYSIPSLWSNCS